MVLSLRLEQWARLWHLGCADASWGDRDGSDGEQVLTVSVAQAKSKRMEERHFLSSSGGLAHVPSLSLTPVPLLSHNSQKGDAISLVKHF